MLSRKFLPNTRQRVENTRHIRTPKHQVPRRCLVFFPPGARCFHSTHPLGAVQKQKKCPKIVMPAEAGIREKQSLMDACILLVGRLSRLRSSCFKHQVPSNTQTPGTFLLKHQAPRRCLVFSFPSCYLCGLKTGPYPSCRQGCWPLPWKCTQKPQLTCHRYAVLEIGMAR